MSRKGTRGQLTLLPEHCLLMGELQACAEDMLGLLCMGIGCLFLPVIDILQLGDYTAEESNFEDSEISIYVSRHVVLRNTGWGVSINVCASC